MNEQGICFGDVFWADLGEIDGTCVQKMVRPVVIISNHYNNEYSPTVNVIPLTGKTKKVTLPVHVLITSCTPRHSLALAEQVTTIAKSQLNLYIGRISDEEMKKLERALKIQLCLAV